MEKSQDTFLIALQREIQRHSLDTFVTDSLSVAEGGTGVVVTGCVACRKRFHTIPQFIDHLAYDVLPTFMDRVRKRNVIDAPQKKQIPPT
jgi:hypothetical protein